MMSRVEPVKLDYATPEPRHEISTARAVWTLIWSCICLSLAVFLAASLVFFFWIGIHFHNRSDPVDPAHVAIPGLIGTFLVAFLANAGWRSLRTIWRR